MRKLFILIFWLCSQIFSQSFDSVTLFLTDGNKIKHIFINCDSSNPYYDGGCILPPIPPYPYVIFGGNYKTDVQNYPEQESDTVVFSSFVVYNVRNAHLSWDNTSLNGTWELHTFPQGYQCTLNDTNEIIMPQYFYYAYLKCYGVKKKNALQINRFLQYSFPVHLLGLNTTPMLRIIIGGDTVYQDYGLPINLLEGQIEIIYRAPNWIFEE